MKLLQLGCYSISQPPTGYCFLVVLVLFFFGGFVSVADMKNDAETIFTTKSAPRRSLLPRPPRGFGDAEIRRQVEASGVPPAHCEHSKLIDGHGIGDWAMGKLQRWA